MRQPRRIGSLIPPRVLPAFQQEIAERRQPAWHGFAPHPHEADLRRRGRFRGEAKQAVQQHVDFLAERGLAERRGPYVILARNLLGRLRSRELMRAAKDIAADTGLEHRLLAEGHVAGIYRRSVMLAADALRDPR